MMNDEESPLPSPVPVAFDGLPPLSEALGTDKELTDCMPLARNRLFEQPLCQFVDLQFVVIRHDRQLLVQICVDQRPDFFSA